MESRAALFGHPLHAILVDFPIALFVASFLFDLFYRARGDPCWRRAALGLIVVGEIAGVGAVAAGLVDYLLISMPPATRRLATLHLYLGLGVVALYGLQIGLRRRQLRGMIAPPRSSPGLMGLAFVSVLAVLAQGALGGELGHVHRVGVVPAPPPSPVPPGQSAAVPAVIAAGRTLFVRECARCHGKNAEGKIGPRLIGNQLDRAFIRKTIAEGRRPLMPAFREKLAPAALDALAAYVRSLGSR